MFAIPGQTLDIWRNTLTEALAIGSEHLSSYEVIYEEDTPLFAQLQAREFDVDEDSPAPCMRNSSLKPPAPVFTNTKSPISLAAHPPTLYTPHSTLLPSLPPQHQLLARRLILRPRSERHELCPRHPNQKLVQHSALFRAT